MKRFVLTILAFLLMCGSALPAERITVTKDSAGTMSHVTAYKTETGDTVWQVVGDKVHFYVDFLDAGNITGDTGVSITSNDSTSSTTAVETVRFHGRYGIATSISGSSVYISTEAGNRYYADPSNANQAVVGNGRTVKALADAIGGTQKASIILPHTSASGITTAYVFTTTLDLSGYPNIHIVPENGAQLENITSGATVTIHPSNLIAAPTQHVFSGGGFAWASGGECWANWWGLVPNDANYDGENSLSFQRAFNAGTAKGVESRIWGEVYYYDTTLYMYDSNLNFSGTGTYLPDLNTGVKDANKGTRLIYTGLGSGLENPTPTVRLWNLRMHDIAFECNNAANVGFGLDLTSINYFDINRVTVSYFGNYGVRVWARTTSGIANCSLTNIKITRCDGGVSVVGNVNAGSGVVADSFFSNITARDLRKNDGTSTDNSSFHIGLLVSKCTFDHLSYKQSGTMNVGYGIYAGGYKNTISNSGGELNATGTTVFYLPDDGTGNAQNIIFNPKLQSVSEIGLASGNRDTIVSANHPLNSRYAWHFAPLDLFIEDPRPSMSYNWGYAAIAGFSGVTYTVFNSGITAVAGAAGVSGYKVPYKGSIVGISIQRHSGSGATAGYMIVRPTINSVYTGVTVAVGGAATYNPDGDVYQGGNQLTDATNYSFEKGDLIGATYNTVSAWNGSGMYVIHLLLAYKPDMDE